MAGLALKYGARYVLGEKLDKLHKDGKGVRGNDDPYFEEIVFPNGKKKKVKRQIPAFIPEHDAAVLVKVKDKAYSYDMSLFSFLGIRFGWESVIGLIPEIGDVIGAAVAYRIYRQCNKIEGGLPKHIQSIMVFNIVVDFLIGLVPFLGDLCDAYWKCNTKNAMALENHLRDKYGPKGKKNKKLRRSAGLEMFENDPDYMRELANAPIRPVTHQWEEGGSDDDSDRRQPPPSYKTQSSMQQGERKGENHTRPQHEASRSQQMGGPRSKGENHTRDQQDASRHQGEKKQPGFWSKYFGSGSGGGGQPQRDPEEGQSRWEGRV